MIFAIIEDGIVANIIEAESNTPFDVIFPNAETAAPFTVESGSPIIGMKYKTGKFQQYPSWTFDETLGEWVAPEPKPEGEFTWSESTLSWIDIPLPTESVEE